MTILLPCTIIGELDITAESQKPTVFKILIPLLGAGLLKFSKLNTMFGFWLKFSLS